MTTSPDLIDGPDRAPLQLILAHGAGAPMDSPFMQAIARGLAAGGVRVVRFEFPYMAARRAGGKQRPPDRAPMLEAAWREAFARHPHPACWIGGKSMGGRFAAAVAPTLPVAGVICLGYPFHPPGRPEKSRLDTLTALRVPTLVVQGERDPFGTRDEVDAMGLIAPVQVEWILDGDHSLVPRKSSGHTEAGHLERAVAAVLGFMRRRNRPTSKAR